MWLRRLDLTNFRSYKDRQVEFDSGVTVVAGPNASGKTNLLEAVYLLAVTKSFRAKDADLVHHGEDHYRLVGQADDSEITLGYQHQDHTTTKRLTVNGAKVSLGSHIGSFKVVLFEPTDLEMLSGAPELRRRYLDFILCQNQPHYLQTLNQYRRVLRQRNALLSNFDTTRISDEIFTWDLKLTETAAAIVEARTRLVDLIGTQADDQYANLAGQRLRLQFSYQASVRGDYADNFMQALKANLTRDLAAGFTTIGPHREDFMVKIGDSGLTSVASRGETRTVVLVLKLVEMAYNRLPGQPPPLLLLDDVFSELDESRRHLLLEALGEHQTIITTTDADAVTGGLHIPYSLIETAAHV